MGAEHVDALIARVAGRQGGVVTYRQLVALGLGRGAIEHRLASGRLHRLHRSVYLVGHEARGPLTEDFAAVLACGTGTLLSFHHAAARWGFRPAAPAPVDVTVIGGDPRRHAGIRIHHVSLALPPVDVRTRDGLPLTAPARTLLDLAEVLTARELRWAVEEARVQRLVAPGDLRSVVERHPRRRGVARLRAALAAAAGGPSLTRSEAERRFAELVAAARLPAPALNVRVGRHEVDALWREQRLIVEVDGYAFHAGREAFERDRRRDAELQASGFVVTRLTWRQITGEPAAVAALLSRLLALAPARGAAG